MTVSAVTSCAALGDCIDHLRVVPRVMCLGYGYVCWRTWEWYTLLLEPTTQQVTFATGIFGAAAVWFGLYVNTRRRQQ